MQISDRIANIAVFQIVLVLSTIALPIYVQGQLIDLERLREISSEKKSGPKPMTTFGRKTVTPAARIGSQKPTIGNRQIEVERLFNAGNAALDRNDYIGAEKAFRQTLTYDPRYPGGYEGLGVVSSRQGCYDDAIEFFNKAKVFDGKNPRPYLNLGFTYSDKGDNGAAIGYFKEALRFMPVSIEARIGLGKAWAELEDIESAEKFFQEAVALKPKLYQPNKSLSDFYFKQKNYEKAALFIKPFVTSQDALERANANETLAWIEVGRGNRKGAINLLKLAIKDNPSVSGSYFFKIGILLMDETSKQLPLQSGDIEELSKGMVGFKDAGNYLKKATLASDPDPWAYFFYGMALSSQSSYQEAEDAINTGLSITDQRRNKVIATSPKCKPAPENDCKNCDLAFAKYVLGYTYMMKGVWSGETEDDVVETPNLDKSIEAYNEAISYETVINGIIYPTITLAYRMKGDNANVIRYGELATLSAGSCDDCLNNNFAFFQSLGEAYLKTSKLSDAAKILQKAIKINSTISETHFWLGQVFEKQSLPIDASIEYREAIRLDPSNKEARLYLGQILVTTGDKEGALEQYDALQRLGADGAKFLLKQINQRFPLNN